MKINLKLKAMSILMAGMQETQMWTIYQMGMGNEMPLSVTKEDLTFIIAFLFYACDKDTTLKLTSLEKSLFP